MSAENSDDQNSSLKELVSNQDNILSSQHDLKLNPKQAKSINNESKKNLHPSQNSYDVHVKAILEDAQKIIKDEASSKGQIRLSIFKTFKRYFIVASIFVALFICCPYYSFGLKSILLSGFLANLIGLLVIIFHYAFSSSKNNYNDLIGKLLNWVIKEHSSRNN